MTTISAELQAHLDTLLMQAQEETGRDVGVAYRLAGETLEIIADLEREGLHFPHEVARALFIQAMVHVHRVELEQAINCNLRATQIFEELQDYEALVRCWNLAGIVFRQIGDFSHATTLFQQAIQLAEEKRLTSVLLFPLNGLASLYTYLGDYDRSIQYLERALAVALMTKSEHYQAVISGNLCAGYHHVGRYEEARQVGEHALEVLERENRPIDLINVLSSLALVYRYTEQPEKAQQSLERALDLATKSESHSNHVAVLYAFAEYYFERSDFEQAKAHFLRMIEVANAHNINKGMYQVHQRLAEIFKREGDFERALDQLEQYLEMRDVVQSQQTNEKLNQLEIRYRTEQARREAQFYRQRSHELEGLREADKRQYEQIARIKQELFSDTSHDLKNPLARIMLNASMLKRYHELDERGLGYIENIISASRLMTDLVEEALELVRLEVALPSEMHTQPLLPLLQDITKTYADVAKERQIALELRYHDQESLQATFNALEMYRVMENLLSNAVKYSPENGRVIVEAWQQPGELLVRVRDSGEGVSEEEFDRIFDRFYRSMKHVHSSTRGTGIGLAIAKKIIQNHSGKIWIERVITGGTAFCFTLPCPGNTV